MNKIEMNEEKKNVGVMGARRPTLSAPAPPTTALKPLRTTAPPAASTMITIATESDIRNDV